MKKAFRVLTAALLAVQSMTSLHTVQADAKTESDRITIENGTFMYEGEPFISIGATDYGRLNSSYVHIEQSISDMAAHGLNTLRMCDYLDVYPAPRTAPARTLNRCLPDLKPRLAGH